MTTTLFTFVKQTFNKLTNVGVYPDMPYVESRYTKLINILNWNVLHVYLCYYQFH